MKATEAENLEEICRFSSRGNPLVSMEEVRSKFSVSVNALIRGTLWISDWYLDFLLVRGQNERWRPSAERISFPQSVRIKIHQRQQGKCMYCGCYLAKGWHIDHIYPREHGGSNDLVNLQGLCPPCNLRKGVQTDEEYRKRFRKLLPPVDPTVDPVPPADRIPKWEFDKRTKQTSLSSSARSRTKSKYKSPRQKIVSGSLITGVFASVTWGASATIVFPLSVPGMLLFILVVGVVVFLVMSSFLIGRARKLGKLVSHDDERVASPDT